MSDGIAERIVTVPNLLSLVRIGTVPVFLGFLLTRQDVAALAVLAAAGLTDFLDGYLARRLGQVTRLGALLDPVADKLTILSATIGLAFRGILPVWLVLVVAAREVVLLVLGAILATHSLPPLPASRAGKAGTFLLLAALPLLVLGAALGGTAPGLLPAGIAVAAVGAAVDWWGAVGYARRTAEWVRNRRDDTPGPSVSLGVRRRSPDGR